MITRTIPGTDLDVSLLAFGNFTVGNNWWKDFTDDEAIALQKHAVDKGVNFFDTAPAYGNGKAEQLLKPVIAYAGRDHLVISTKFGYDLVADPGEEGSHRERRQDFSEKNIRRELEQSLDTLGIDCIDLYQAHNIKLEHFSDELFALMDTLIDEGKIRAWGAALGPAIGWREEGHRAFLDHDAATVQTVFNLYEQDPGRELCEIADKRGRGGVIARVPTNSGMLDEEFASADHKFPDRDHRKFRDKAWLVHGLEKNKMVKPMAEELGLSLRQFAFKWLAGVPGMVAIEPNLLETSDVDAFAAAAEHPLLPDDLLEELNELYAEDFGLGDAAHPCDIKSSVAEGGSERSSYQAPAMA
jgi:aryl-alcohol dehydrogenase-like predicted oxidoreductase